MVRGSAGLLFNLVALTCGCCASCRLGGTKVGEGGAVALAKALEVNSSLHTLEYVSLESVVRSFG